MKRKNHFATFTLIKIYLSFTICNLIIKTLFVSNTLVGHPVYCYVFLPKKCNKNFLKVHPLHHFFAIPTSQILWSVCLHNKLILLTRLLITRPIANWPLTCQNCWNFITLNLIVRRALIVCYNWIIVNKSNAYKDS